MERDVVGFGVDSMLHEKRSHPLSQGLAGKTQVKYMAVGRGVIRNSHQPGISLLLQGLKKIQVVLKAPLPGGGIA